jgi:hypothetical protein
MSSSSNVAQLHYMKDNNLRQVIRSKVGKFGFVPSAHVIHLPCLPPSLNKILTNLSRARLSLDETWPGEGSGLRHRYSQIDYRLWTSIPRPGYPRELAAGSPSQATNWQEVRLTSSGTQAGNPSINKNSPAVASPPTPSLGHEYEAKLTRAVALFEDFRGCRSLVLG